MRILFFIGMLSCACITQAQQRSSRIVPGVKAGIAISSLGPDFTDSMGTHYKFVGRVTLTAGVRAEYSIGQKIKLLPELNLVDKMSRVEKSYRYSGESSYSSGAIFLEFVPNLLYLFTGPQQGVFVGAGPSFAFKLTQYSDLENSDVGINLLLGYKLSSGFSLELNYNKGLKAHKGDITAGYYPYFLNNTTLKTSCFSFCIAYSF